MSWSRKSSRPASACWASSTSSTTGHTLARRSKNSRHPANSSSRVKDAPASPAKATPSSRPPPPPGEGPREQPAPPEPPPPPQKRSRGPRQNRREPPAPPPPPRPPRRRPQDPRPQPGSQPCLRGLGGVFLGDSQPLPDDL